MSLSMHHPSGCNYQAECPVCMTCPVVTGATPITSVTLTPGQSYFDTVAGKWYYYNGTTTQELFKLPDNATFQNLVVSGSLSLSQATLNNLATALCPAMQGCISGVVASQLATYTPPPMTLAQLAAMITSGAGISVAPNATSTALVITNTANFDETYFNNVGTVANPIYTLDIVALCAALAAANCALGSGGGGSGGTGGETVVATSVGWTCEQCNGVGPINNAPAQYQATIAPTPAGQTLTLQTYNGTAWVNNAAAIIAGCNVLPLSAGTQWRVLGANGAVTASNTVAAVPPPCSPIGA